MNLEFKRLSEIPCSEYVAFHTNPLVMPQMPWNDADLERVLHPAETKQRI